MTGLITTSYFKTDRGAEFSADRKYRYALWRIWDRNKPIVMFIGLNPSTANETQNDPTIRRVIKFAMRWNYGGVVMMNLFGIVSSDPSILLDTKNAIGDNDQWIDRLSFECKDVVFAWGNFKQAKQRGEIMAQKFPRAYALQINKNGSPKHPLYVKNNTDLITFRTSTSKKPKRKKGMLFPTRLALEKALSKIGWSISKSHNELNDYFINHKGIATSFVMYGEKEIQIREELFGESFCGGVYLSLHEMELIEGSSFDNNVIDYICLKMNNGNYISFYNHDKR